MHNNYIAEQMCGARLRRRCLVRLRVEADCIVDILADFGPDQLAEFWKRFEKHATVAPR